MLEYVLETLSECINILLLQLSRYSFTDKVSVDVLHTIECTFLYAASAVLKLV